MIGDSGTRDIGSLRTTWNAAAYDALHGYVIRGGAGVLDLLNPQPGERVLDLGCGTGQLTQQIADRGADVVGIDNSADMVARARAAFPTLDIRLADATAFAVDEPCDAVFSNAALHWIPRGLQPLATTCIAGALRPGGRLVAELGGSGNVRRIVVALQRVLAEMGLGPVVDTWYFPSIGEHASLLERHGFEVLQAELFDRPTPLEDGELGLRHWLEMFTPTYLAAAAGHRRDELIQRVEDRLRPDLHRENGWWADYRRLRFVAVRM